MRNRTNFFGQIMKTRPKRSEKLPIKEKCQSLFT